MRDAHMSGDERLAVDPRQRTGARGEQLAAEHLRRRGYAVIARNARTRHGEIDLIAFEPASDARHSALVFVEVKTRRLRGAVRAPPADQQPLTGLRPAQRARLRRLAAAWLADRRRPRPFAQEIRFDAIGVTLDTAGAALALEHVENAW